MSLLVKKGREEAEEQKKQVYKKESALKELEKVILEVRLEIKAKDKDISQFNENIRLKAA